MEGAKEERSTIGYKAATNFPVESHHYHPGIYVTVGVADGAIP
jgi:hypothetical protein